MKHTMLAILCGLVGAACAHIANRIFGDGATPYIMLSCAGLLAAHVVANLIFGRIVTAWTPIHQHDNPSRYWRVQITLFLFSIASAAFGLWLLFDR